MTPDYDASIAFLQRWSPEGPWVLTAIDTERKSIATRTFRADQSDEVRSWLETYRDRNVYFHVNPVLREITKKATREDVKSMAWLHVDIDPRVGEDIKEEQERALGLLKDPPGELPPPTCIVFSGGGYQGFWKLAEPVEINGQEAAYEEAKRYNVQLELLFGADNCHNVDRIMRLPGSINHPDKKKKEKGRTEVMAELIEFDESRVYPLNKFTPAPLTQSGDEGGGFVGGHPVEVSGNIERLKGVDDPRLASVDDRAKAVIVQGNDPEDPTKFAKDGGSGLDRSKALFYVCCEMVRGDCNDDTIYAVITDPDFGISDSVLDKGSMSEKYALRQISRARENAIAPELREMNEKHAVIRNWGGKCRVIEEQYDRGLQRYKITCQSFDDLRNGYMHRQVMENGGNGKVTYTPLGKWWLQHPHRRQYDTVLFAPGHETPGSYNLWRGFACDAKPGNCDKLLNHVKRVLCRDNEEHYEYLLGWMANAVQNPDSPGYSAVVLRGQQGTGKSFFASHMMGALFGRHFLHVSDPKHLVGSFNAHLRDCVVLFGDEAFYAGDKKHESVLKMLVTEDMLIIEPKGVDAEMGSNCVHLIMASNDDWVVPAGLDDRRFFVLDVSDEHKEDMSYFRELREELASGGQEALLHYLMTYDLSGFNVRKVPKTRALQEQKLHSMDPYEEWWFQKLRSGQLLDDHGEWQHEIPALDLQNDFIDYAKGFNLSKRGNATKLGQVLKRFLPEDYPRLRQRATPIEIQTPQGGTKYVKRPYFYEFPTLEECREYWDTQFGGPYDWKKPIDESPIIDSPF